MNFIKVYAKAELAFLAVLCTSLGTAANDGSLSLAEVLTSIGGALVGSGIVASVPNKSASGPV